NAHAARPSSAINIARCRRTDPPSLTRLLRSDLDWIVMKCLEKDRTGRYETANGLAMDVSRHLRDEPVVAGPPGAGYRLRKFVRRNRGRVTAATVIVLLLVASICGTTLALLRADRQRQVAEAREKAAVLEAAKAHAVTTFLRNMLSSVNPNLASGREVTVRETLAEASRSVDAELAEQPEVRALVQSTIGSTYESLGQCEQAIP